MANRFASNFDAFNTAAQIVTVAEKHSDATPVRPIARTEWNPLAGLTVGEAKKIALEGFWADTPAAVRLWVDGPIELKGATVVASSAGEAALNTRPLRTQDGRAGCPQYVVFGRYKEAGRRMGIEVNSLSIGEFARALKMVKEGYTVAARGEAALAEMGIALPFGRRITGEEEQYVAAAFAQAHQGGKGRQATLYDVVLPDEVQAAAVAKWADKYERSDEEFDKYADAVAAPRSYHGYRLHTGEIAFFSSKMRLNPESFVLFSAGNDAPMYLCGYVRIDGRWQMRQWEVRRAIEEKFDGIGTFKQLGGLVVGHAPVTGFRNRVAKHNAYWATRTITAMKAAMMDNDAVLDLIERADEIERQLPESKYVGAEAFMWALDEVGDGLREQVDRAISEAFETDEVKSASWKMVGAYLPNRIGIYGAGKVMSAIANVMKGEIGPNELEMLAYDFKGMDQKIGGNKFFWLWHLLVGAVLVRAEGSMAWVKNALEEEVRVLCLARGGMDINAARLALK